MDYPKGKFYVIGTGPAGVEQTTLQALRYIEQSDMILCSDEIKIEFSEYIKDKPILCNPWNGLWDYRGIPWGELAQSDAATIEAFKKERLQLREEIVSRVKAAMAEGRNVALIESGDPGIFGPSYWFVESFDEDEVEVIPGVGVFSSAMAALKRTAIPAFDTRFVLQTSPLMLPPGAESEIFADMAKYPATLVFYMAFWGFDRLIEQLRPCLPPETPVAVLYYVGDAEKQKVVKGSLDDILERVKSIREDFSGFVVVGRCLEEGTPYRSRVEDLVRI